MPKPLNIVVKTSDQASSGLKKIFGNFQRFGADIVSLYAFTKLARSVLDLVKAYGAQEKAELTLRQAMQQTGTYTQYAWIETVKYAGELQKLTSVGDEVIIEAQRQLTTFGLYGDKLNETTKAALDLSAGLGIDLKAATLLLGKAALGETQTLSRYGIVIEEGLNKTQKFDAALQQVQQRFGGAAQAAAQTTIGQLEQMNLQYGDLKEKIGELLVGGLNIGEVFKFWGEVLSDVNDYLSEIMGSFKELNKMRLTEVLAEEDKLEEKLFEIHRNLDDINRLRVQSGNYNKMQNEYNILIAREAEINGRLLDLELKRTELETQKTGRAGIRPIITAGKEGGKGITGETAASARLDAQIKDWEAEQEFIQQQEESRQEQLMRHAEYYDSIMGIETGYYEQRQNQLAAMQELYDAGILSEREYQNTITQIHQQSRQEQVAAMDAKAGGYQQALQNMGQMLGIGNKQMAMLMIPFELAHAAADFAEGIWPPNPAALAAGTAHLAAAASWAQVAKASAKGKGGGETGGGGGGRGRGGGGGQVPGAGRAQPPVRRQEIVIYGAGRKDDIVINPEAFAKNIIEQVSEQWEADVTHVIYARD